MTDKENDSKENPEYEFKPLHEDQSAEVDDSSPSQQIEATPELASPDSIPPVISPPPAQSWMARNKKLALFLGFILIAGLMWLVSLSRNKKTPAPDPAGPTNVIDEVPVNVIEARLGRFIDEISAVGTLKGEAEIELRFEVEGKITTLNFFEGDRVKRGQILARISERDAQLKVDRAKNELEKNEKLFTLGGISNTKLNETRLDLEVAQTELDKTRLIATRDGIIGDKAADIGEYVTPQRKIATLVAIKKVLVKIGIIEKEVDKVYPGQKLLITVDAYAGKIFEGNIQSISPIIEGEAKTFEITATILNDESLLLPGMFARARIITYEADDAISVPSDALVKSQGAGGFQVYVINKDNVAEVREVVIGYVAAEETQINSGLSPGEVVVVQKPPELKAGSKVKIIEVQNN